MGRDHAETFESLRSDVLAKLVDIRTSIDRAYERIPDDVVSGQFDVVLGRMALYLKSGDSSAYRGFVTRWAAMREGEGFGPENVVHSVVAIGDVVVRAAQKKFGPGERTDFLRAVTDATALSARWLVEALAGELAERTAQLAVLECDQ